MMQWDGWGHMGGMGLYWIVGLVVAVVIVIGLILAIRALGASAPGGRPGAGVSPASSAEEVLKQRYARGEIDREEYRTRLADLRR
jgi:putative membrane protein